MVKNLIFVACASLGMALTSDAQGANPTGPTVLDHLQPDHATISVQDVDKEREWYERVLGFKFLKRMTNPTSQVTMLVIPGYRIDLLKQNGSSRPPFTEPQALRQGYLHVVFNVPPSEVQAAYDVLKARGSDVKPSALSVGANKEHPGIWLLQMHDPEGNEVEIVARGE